MKKREPVIEQHSIASPEVKPLYRGIWAENLTNDQELPVGGFRGQAELTQKLKLDFDQFASQVKSFTRTNIRASYEQEKQALASWLNRTVSDNDLYLIYVANKVLRKMQELLEIEPKQTNRESERRSQYATGTPALSELKGMAMCTEQAALGQFLLQQAGVESAYVGGISMDDAKDEEDWSVEHSYLVVKNPDNLEDSYIFDIARPHQRHNLARVLKPAVPFNYELLKDRKELFVLARDIVQGGGELWFGVGEQASGKHAFIENETKD